MVHLEDMPTNGVFFEIIGTGVLLALAGLLLWLPFVFALVLTVGTPVALFLLNKGYVSELLWMAIGAFFTGVIAAGVSHFSEFPDYFLLGGTLTGYFACRQTANFREPKA